MTDHRPYFAAALSLFVLAVPPAHATDKFKITILGTCGDPRTLHLVVGNENQALPFFWDRDYRKEAWRHRWPEGLKLPDTIIASLRFDGARTNCYKPAVRKDDEGFGNVSLINFTCIPHQVTSVTISTESDVTLRWKRDLRKTKGSEDENEVDCHEFGGPGNSTAFISNARFPDESVRLLLFFEKESTDFLLNELDEVKNVKAGKATVPVNKDEIIGAICRSKVQLQSGSNCLEHIPHPVDKLKMTLTTLTTEP
jgi:hypothetical protein